MLITIKNNLNISPDFFKYKIKSKAIMYIFSHKLSPHEKILDTFLKKKFSISLKVACLQIINKITPANNFQGDIVLIIKNTYWDKMFRLITFGNEKIKGSRLLIEALSVYKERS